MNKFNRLRTYRLTNAQHFAFIHAFIQYAQSTGFSAQKILTALQTLVTVFGTEDSLYMLVKASEIIAQKEEADRRRDSYYSRLHRLVLAWAGSGMAELDPAASELLKPFQLYKVKVNAQLDEETGQLLNLITDLSTPANLARLETINGTYLFNQLVAANNEVVSLRIEQGGEESEKVKGALAAARRETDAAYETILSIIEAASVFADEPATYEAFIKQWNGTVKLYQDMLDRKSGTSSSGSSSSSNSGSSSSQQGGTTENGSEQGGGTEQGGDNGGTTPPGGGGTLVDDDPEIPGSGGGENTGGGLPPSGGGETYGGTGEE